MKLNDPTEIDALVLRYQEGDDEAGSALVAAYQPFIDHYMDMLDGQIDYSVHKDRWFVSLFIKDPVAKRAMRRKHVDRDQFRYGIWHSRRVFDTLVEIIAIYEKEDLRQDLICEFLAIAKKYRPLPGKHFGAYLLASFPYKVVNVVKRIGRNPTMYNIPDITGYAENGVTETFLPPELWVEEDYDLDADEGDLGLDWVMGTSCSDLFLALTSEERQILQLRYVEGFTDSLIAEILNLKFNYVKQTRLSAIDKLQERLQDCEKNTDED